MKAGLRPDLTVAIAKMDNQVSSVSRVALLVTSLSPAPEMVQAQAESSAIHVDESVTRLTSADQDKTTDPSLTKISYCL